MEGTLICAYYWAQLPASQGSEHAKHLLPISVSRVLPTIANLLLMCNLSVCLNQHMYQHKCARALALRMGYARLEHCTILAPSSSNEDAGN